MARRPAPKSWTARPTAAARCSPCHASCPGFRPKSPELGDRFEYSEMAGSPEIDYVKTMLAGNDRLQGQFAALQADLPVRAAGSFPFRSRRSMISRRSSPRPTAPGRTRGASRPIGAMRWSGSCGRQTCSRCSAFRCRPSTTTSRCRACPAPTRRCGGRKTRPRPTTI